jgi:hypothetical protein
MKGANPFTPWGAGPQDFIGRKPEIEMYGSFLKGIGAGMPEVLLAAGAPGSGRSALLRRLQQESAKAGVFAPLVSAGDGERFPSFLSKLSSELLAYAQEKEGEGALSDRMLSGLKAASGGEDMLLSFARMALKHAGGVVLLVDDADRLGRPDELIQFVARMMKAVTAERLRFGFLLSFSEGFGGFSAMGREMRLGPFEEHDLREMVDGALKKGPKMGEECFRTLNSESEGNPLVAKTICWVIYDRLPDNEKIMTQRHYLTYYPAIMSTLSREFFDRLYLELPASEREVLRAFASAGKPAYISDIARTIGKRHATTLALRLVERGQLVRVDRGLYRVFTKLYGRYVLQRG